jgi:hypothetical protein
MSQLEVDKVIPQSGTTLTLGESGDTVSVPSGATIDTSGATLTLPTTIEVDAIEPKTATTLTLGASGDTITIPSGATLSNLGTATGFGANTPAFQATLSSQQNVSDATATKANCNTEDFDTDNAYDNVTNYRFTPQVAGKYFVYGQIATNNTSVYLQHTKSIIRKNGSDLKVQQVFGNGNFIFANSIPVVAIATMNGTTDYLEIFGFCDSASGQNIFSATDTYFGAYRLIGV